MAWSCLQDEQRPASKNRKQERGRLKTTWRRTMEEELKAATLTLAQQQGKPNTEGSGEILCEPYVPHGMKRLSK